MATLTTDRREFARLFRSRLNEAMARTGISGAALAREIKIDRSTLSQLLSEESERLPRADTVAAIASALQVSVDWLLGLTQETRRSADILLESLQIARAASPADEGLARWHEEALGYKIRYVPTTLPDLAKTDAVVDHEYRHFVSRSTDQVLAAGKGRLEYSRMPETDMEICMPVQGLTGFTRAEAMWEGLSIDARREQLDRLVQLAEELYPSLRFYLFDALTHYCVPLTVFGPLRAVIYIGQMYFVFNTTEHVRVLTRHFDSLIRAAVVQANDASRFFRDLRAEVGN